MLDLTVQSRRANSRRRSCSARAHRKAASCRPCMRPCDWGGGGGQGRNPILPYPNAAPRLDVAAAAWLARSMKRYSRSGWPMSVASAHSSRYVARLRAGARW